MYEIIQNPYIYATKIYFIWQAQIYSPSNIYVHKTAADPKLLKWLNLLLNCSYNFETKLKLNNDQIEKCVHEHY